MVSVYWFWVKVAVTALLLVIVTVVGETEPDASTLHASKLHPTLGTAVKVTTVPSMYVA